MTTPDRAANDGRLTFDCQEQLVALYETLVDVMFCAKSIDGTYLHVNQAFVRRTGLGSKRAIIGRTAAEVFNPDFAERYEEQDRQVFASGEPLRDALEVIRVQDGGVGWYLTTKLPAFAPDDARSVAGLLSVSRDLASPPSDSIALEGLAHVVTHVRDHLADKLRVDELALVAGCSPDQLERRVKKVFGLTAKQYVLHVRVEQAAVLLTTTALPLADIAPQVGFYDQSDFTRRFARLTNQTPAQFRSGALGRKPGA